MASLFRSCRGPLPTTVSGSVAGIEGSQSLRRASSIRRAFTSGTAGIKRKSLALQLKFQVVRPTWETWNLPSPILYPHDCTYQFCFLGWPYRDASPYQTSIRLLFCSSSQGRPRRPQFKHFRFQWRFPSRSITPFTGDLMQITFVFITSKTILFLFSFAEVSYCRPSGCIAKAIPTICLWVSLSAALTSWFLQMLFPCPFWLDSTARLARSRPPRSSYSTSTWKEHLTASVSARLVTYLAFNVIYYLVGDHLSLSGLLPDRLGVLLLSGCFVR